MTQKNVTQFLDEAQKLSPLLNLRRLGFSLEDHLINKTVNNTMLSPSEALQILQESFT